MQIHDLFEQKAREGNGSFAIAFAILKLTDEQRNVYRALDRLGMNAATPQAGPGAMELIGMELKRVADAVEFTASKD